MTAPKRGALLYEGKAKQVYETSEPDLVWMYFKDDATAFNGVKKASIAEKGAINGRISARLLEEVGRGGVATHLREVRSARDHICTRVEIIPVEVVVRNVCAGSLARRFGRPIGCAPPSASCAS